MSAHRDPSGVPHELPNAQPVPTAPGSWRSAADALRRNQLGPLAALLVEVASPLTLMLSQFLYVGAPFLGTRATNWARFLESESNMANLAHYLGTGVDDADSSGRPGQ